MSYLCVQAVLGVESWEEPTALQIVLCVNFSYMMTFPLAKSCVMYIEACISMHEQMPPQYNSPWVIQGTCLHSTSTDSRHAQR